MKRRDFVQSGLLSSVAGRFLPAMFLQMLIEGRYTQALAQQSQAPPRRLLDIHMAGGVPGWIWSLPLSPFSTQTFQHNIAASNYVESNGQPTYRTTAIQKASKTFHMPHLWSTTIPTSAGLQVPMSDLMDQMMILRGYKYSGDGHFLNFRESVWPEIGQRSFSGLVADAAQAQSIPIPAVTTDQPYANTFRAHRAGVKSLRWQNLVETTSVLSDLMLPFTPNQGMKTLLSKRASFSQAFDAAMLALKRDAQANNQKNDSAFNAVASAEQLIKRDFGNLTEAYSQLVSKYDSLIAGCTNMESVLSAVTPPTSGSGSQWRRVNMSGMTLATNPDLRQIIKANTKPSLLAEVFAVAEFLLTQNLSTSILGGVGSAENLDLRFIDDAGQEKLFSAAGFDEHFTGVAVSIVINTFVFKAVAACTYELIQRLKQQGAFDETVIRLFSEFSRSPRDSQGDELGGTGSDHGWTAGHYMTFCGAIKKPFIIGNTRINSDLNNGSYRGSWGSAARSQTPGSILTKELTWHEASSTLAKILRVPSPTPTAASVVSESSTDGIVAMIGDSENKNE